MFEACSLHPRRLPAVTHAQAYASLPPPPPVPDICRTISPSVHPPSSSPSQGLPPLSGVFLPSDLLPSAYLSVMDTPSLSCSVHAPAEGQKHFLPMHSALQCTCERGSVKETSETTSIFESHLKDNLPCKIVGPTTTLPVFPCCFATPPSLLSGVTGVLLFLERPPLRPAHRYKNGTLSPANRWMRKISKQKLRTGVTAACLDCLFNLANK